MSYRKASDIDVYEPSSLSATDEDENRSHYHLTPGSDYGNSSTLDDTGTDSSAENDSSIQLRVKAPITLNLIDNVHVGALPAQHHNKETTTDHSTCRGNDCSSDLDPSIQSLKQTALDSSALRESPGNAACGISPLYIPAPRFDPPDWSSWERSTPINVPELVTAPQSVTLKECENMTIKMKDGRSVRFVRSHEKWEADVIDSHGALTRRRRLPVVNDGSGNVGILIRGIFRLPARFRKNRVHVIEKSHSPSHTCVFVGELGLRGGKRGYRPSNPDMKLTAVQLDEIMERRGITSTAMLANAYETCQDEEEKQGLFYWIQRCVTIFEDMSSQYVIEAHIEILDEYVHFGLISSTENKALHLKQQVLDSLVYKFDRDPTANKQMFVSLRIVMESVLASSYTDRYAMMNQFIRNLTSFLRQKPVSLIEENYHYYAEVLHLLHEALCFERALDWRSYAGFGQRELTESVLDWIENTVEKMSYYPAKHHLYVMQQALKWLESCTAAMQKTDNKGRFVLLYDEAVTGLESAFKRKILDFDLEIAKNSVVSATSTTKESVRKENWYSWHLALENACLWTLRDAEGFEYLLLVKKHLLENSKKLNSLELRRAACVSFVRCLLVLARLSDSRDIRLMSIEAIIKHLESPRRWGENWSHDQEVAVEVLSALESITCHGADDEHSKARAGIEEFVERSKNSAVYSRTLLLWMRGRSLEDCLEASDLLAPPLRARSLFDELWAETRDDLPPENEYDRHYVILPAPRVTRFFSGRKKEVNEIVWEFESADRNALVVRTLVGAAGIGKSELAAQVFDRMSSSRIVDYDSVCWVPASTEDELMKAYLAISESLRVRIDHNNLDETVRKTRQRLGEMRCLLVFDDAPRADSVQNYLPFTKGHVLITTRNRRGLDWTGTPYVIGRFGVEDTIELCKNMRIPPTENFKDQVRKVFDNLPKYPLYLCQYFASIHMLGYAPTEWMKSFKALGAVEKMKTLIDHLGYERKHLGDIDRGLDEIVQNSVKELHAQDEKIGPISEQLLLATAHFDSVDIPVSVAIECCPIPGDGDQSVFHRAFELLESFSVANYQKDRGMLQVNSEIQLGIRYHNYRDGLKSEQGAKLVRAIGNYIDAAMSDAEQENARILMLPHMKTLYEHLKGPENEEEAIKLMTMLKETCLTASGADGESVTTAIDDFSDALGAIGKI